MNKRDQLKQQAQDFITQLKAEYDATINSKELEKYTPEAKDKYVKETTQKYYDIARKKRDEYRESIYAAGQEEIATTEKNKSDEKRLKEINGQKSEEIMKQNNALLYSSFILQNGTTTQILNLIEKYKDNDEIIEMIETQSDKEGYENIRLNINKLKIDSIQQLKTEVESEYFYHANKFPHLTGLGQTIEVLFNIYQMEQDKFFK